MAPTTGGDTNQIAVDPPRVDGAPFFCVLEDDALITGVSVETDRLLKADDQGVGGSRVFLVMNFTLRAAQLTLKNMELVA